MFLEQDFYIFRRSPPEQLRIFVEGRVAPAGACMYTT